MLRPSTLALSLCILAAASCVSSALVALHPIPGPGQIMPSPNANAGISSPAAAPGEAGNNNADSAPNAANALPSANGPLTTQATTATNTGTGSTTTATDTAPPTETTLTNTGTADAPVTYSDAPPTSTQSTDTSVPGTFPLSSTDGVPSTTQTGTDTSSPAAAGPAPAHAAPRAAVQKNLGARHNARAKAAHLRSR